MKHILKNGLTVIIEKRKSDSISVEALVKVGSNQENKNIFGISHFIEHMVFKGTKTKNAKEVGALIENVGGQINAYTNKERTAFYGKVPQKHFSVLLDVISDIVQNPVFDLEELKKEKNVVISEAKIWKDQPRLNQWLLLEKTLWKNHPCKNPIVGTIETIKKITRDDVLNYYKKFYVPNNTILTIVGDINENNINLIKEKFENSKKYEVNIKKFKEETLTKNKQTKIKKDTSHSYFVLGFLGPDRLNKDSYVMDIIQNILGYGMSSRLFTEIREKRGLAYEVKVAYEASIDFGYFVISLSTDKKNIKLAKELILKEFEKLKNIDEKEIDITKESMEGQFLLEYEDTNKLADLICFWEMIKDYNLYKEYIKNIKSVNKKDIARVIDKYFKNYAEVIIEQK